MSLSGELERAPRLSSGGGHGPWRGDTAGAEMRQKDGQGEGCPRRVSAFFTWDAVGGCGLAHRSTGPVRRCTTDCPALAALRSCAARAAALRKQLPGARRARGARLLQIT